MKKQKFKRNQNFIKNHPFNSQKGDNDFFSLKFVAKSCFANVYIDWNCFSGKRSGP